MVVIDISNKDIDFNAYVCILHNRKYTYLSKEWDIFLM